MTRFARAHGSKAANERTPEEATPWSLMKLQMVEHKNKVESHAMPRNVVSSVFMKGSVKNSFTSPGPKVWEVFDSDKKEHVLSKKDNMKDQGNKLLSADLQKVRKPNKKTCTNVSHGNRQKELFVKGNMFKVSSKIDVDILIFNKQGNGADSFKEKKITDNDLSTSDFKNNKFQYESHQIWRERTSSETIGNLKNITEIIEENKYNLKKKGSDSLINSNVSNFKTNSQNNNYICNKKVIIRHNDFSSVKNFNNQRHSSIAVEGKFFKISEFDGFAVKKEDAKRLCKLRRDLFVKGVPRKEVKVVLKAERRRAEKALARDKKAVCFKCRKFGHNMSECPDCDDPSGVCFKCGSTEHSVKDCRVVQNDSFKYACCFICQEQGHIARQCPDNPRGLYPKGGACKVCGDVTHLKKDCPELISEKEINSITVGTVGNDSIEVLDEDLKENGRKSKNTKKTSYVKF